MDKYLIRYLILNGVTILVALPFIRNKVPPNRSIGIRTPKTMADKEIWYAANRFAGIMLALAGCVSIAGLAVIRIFPGLTAAGSYSTANLLVFVVPLACAIVAAAWRVISM